MDPLDPRHGTYAGAAQHRTDDEPLCTPCNAAWLNYGLVYKKERALGYVRRVPATHGGAWNRIDTLRNGGNSYRAIAEALGLRENHVYRIHTGLIKSVSPDTWRKIMARDGNWDALNQPTHIGTVRRARALATRGWPGTYIQREAGLAKKTMVRLIRGELTTTEYATRRAVAEVYERLWNETPPPSKHAVRARRRAQREGWESPLAWDDIDHDTHPAGSFERAPRRDSIDPVRVHRILNLRDMTLAPEATHAERTAVVAGWPGSLYELEELTGWRADRYKTGAA